MSEQEEDKLIKLKIFLSYSDDNKVIAGKFKIVLERYFGFKVFLAHDDLELETEWNPEIINNLKKCNVVLPLITKEFTLSQFANQEVGIAIGWNKKIISIKMNGTNKFGFLSIYQAASYKEMRKEIEIGVQIDEGYLRTAALIFNHLIVSKKCSLHKYKRRAISSLISALRESPSYKTSMITSRALIEAEKNVSLKPWQLRQLSKSIKTNPEVYNSYAYSDLKKLLVKYNEKIES